LGDVLGWTVGVDDFGNGPESDLVAAADENLGSALDAGSVNVLYGSAAGLTSSGNQVWNQDSSGIKDTAEIADLFGIGLSLGRGTEGRRKKPRRSRPQQAAPRRVALGGGRGHGHGAGPGGCPCPSSLLVDGKVRS